MILKPNIHEEKKVHQTKKDKPQSTRSHQQKPSSYKKPLWFMMLFKPPPCKLNKDCIFVLQTSMEHEFPCCLNKLFRNALLTASCYCRQHKNTFLLTNEPLKDSFLWQIWSWEVKKSMFEYLVYTQSLNTTYIGLQVRMQTLYDYTVYRWITCRDRQGKIWRWVVNSMLWSTVLSFNALYLGWS